MSDLIKREDAIDVAKQHWYKPDIAKALEELPSAFHWTPCSEAQPKENGEYLVTLQFKWAKEIDIGEWLDGRWIGLYADDIVAWMDLPEVWEEGTDES